MLKKKQQAVVVKKLVIPFSLIPLPLLRRVAPRFRGVGKYLEKALPYYQLELDRADFSVKARDYLAMCIIATLSLFFFLTFISVLVLLDKNPYLAIPLGVFISVFVFILQLNYPKVAAQKRIRKLDVDLLAALRAIMIQLNAGVSLFEALVIISTQEFGEFSNELKKMVQQINAGIPQIEALEVVTLRNPSPYFRRALWQIINGMKEGAQINAVIEQVISSLNKEQIIQIEKYGAQLSPLAMFYMIIAVIFPALGVTFLIILTSFIQLSGEAVQWALWGLLAFVMFFQLLFSGTVKSQRPSLLGE